MQNSNPYLCVSPQSAMRHKLNEGTRMILEGNGYGKF